MWRVFRCPKTWRQSTAITTWFTTFSPQKHHQKTRTFPSTPIKNARKAGEIGIAGAKIF
jgi:hypothetical protein